MPTIQAGGIRFTTLSIFENQGITHGFFMRHGGVSPDPWGSLNTATTVGDSRENVIENRTRIFSAIGRRVESLYDVWQVHSNRVICTAEARPLDEPPIRADAIVTDRIDVTLFMRFADCVPIMLFDPIRGVIGMAHAGWKGTVHKIGRDTVAAMTSQYGSRPGDILAGIGPSIGPDHYEVGADVIAQVEHAFGTDAASLLFYKNGRTFFDLWKANLLVLQKAGVENVQISEICTACNTQDWYSHRAERGRAGRFGAIMAMSE
jgi:YfiH family protein